MRLRVRVYPAASRTQVGGRYGQEEPPVLMVRVTAPAAGGRANQAMIRMLASALGVPSTNLSIVAGHSAKTKIVDVSGADPGEVERLLNL